jgi:hypothetical protein
MGGVAVLRSSSRELFTLYAEGGLFDDPDRHKTL